MRSMDSMDIHMNSVDVPGFHRYPRIPWNTNRNANKKRGQKDGRGPYDNPPNNPDRSDLVVSFAGVNKLLALALSDLVVSQTQE